MSNKNFQSYAIALYDLAKTMQDKENSYEEVLKLNGVIKTFPEVAKVLSSVTIGKEERKHFITEILNALDFSQGFIYWIWAIIDNNDFANFKSIAYYCIETHHDIFNITRVNISSATELNANQIEKIKDFLQKKLNTNIDLNVKVKPELIYGLKIQLNNKTYNNTVENKLKNLKRELLSKKG